MSLSVRSRLALAFAAIGAIGFAVIAVLTPGVVRNTLEDDLLESEAAAVDAQLSFVFDDTVFDGLVIETDGVGAGVAVDRTDTSAGGPVVVAPADDPFDAVFGDVVVMPTIAAPNSEQYLAVQLALLAEAGRLDDVVDAADGPFVLAMDSATAFLVDTDGTIVEQLTDMTAPDRPILSSFELDQYLFDELGLVAVDDDTLVQLGDAPLLLESVDFAGVEYIVAADGTAIDESVRRTRALLWTGVPVAAVVAAVLAWLLTSRALRPVAAITDRAATITAGTLDARVPVPGTDDEIAELATTVNAMLDRIDDDDQRRRRFVSDASHELRTPVAVMRNEAEVALRHPGESTTTQLAEAVADETRRLGDVIDDLLALARHDERAGGPLGEVDLDDVVLEESTRARRVPVDTSRVSAGRVAGTSTDLRRLVAHLMDNAARHADSAVTVSLRAADDEVVLLVDDDGPGIAPSDRSAVFERFTRLDEARSRDGGGAGLGLSVVREIAHRSGGSIRIDDAPGGGARFELCFPAR